MLTDLERVGIIDNGVRLSCRYSVVEVLGCDMSMCQKTTRRDRQDVRSGNGQFHLSGLTAGA